MDSSSRRSSQGSERSKHNNDNNDNNITSPSDGNNEHSPEQKSRSATNSPTMHNVQRQDTDAEVETTYGGSEGGGNNSASDSHSSSPLLPMTRTHAAFVSKLYNMVEDPGIQDLIGWSERGDMFRVSNPTAFSKNVLPRYFKHNNWQSFVRQLNMYGFNKVNDMIHSNMRNENQTWEFRHPHFRRGQVDELQNIKRKSVKSGNRSSARMASLLQGPGESSSEALQGGGAGVGGAGGASSTMQREYAYLEGRLQQITSTFSILQSEMTSLRIILSKQQGVIEDIVQLIRSAEENQRTDSSNASTPASENLSRKVNALRQQLQSIREPSLFTGPASLQQQTSDRTSSASPMSRILEAKKEQPPLPLGSPDSIPSRNISSSSPTTTLEQQQQQQQHHHHYSWPDQAFSSSQIYTRGIKLQHSEQQQEQDPAPRTKSSIMGLGERSHLLNPAPSSDTNRGKDLKRPRPAHEE